MSSVVPYQNRRQAPGPDRRRFPRGGRREGDLPGRHPTIAVIDRYDGVRRPVVRYLEHFNFNVAEAADVDGGLALLQAATPAVLLIEEGDGMSFERLQQAARALSIPFVAMASGLGDAPVPADAAGILSKPFTLGTMLDEIRRVLRAQMLEAKN